MFINIKRYIYLISRLFLLFCIPTLFAISCKKTPPTKNDTNSFSVVLNTTYNLVTNIPDTIFLSIAGSNSSANYRLNATIPLQFNDQSFNGDNTPILLGNSNRYQLIYKPQSTGIVPATLIISDNYGNQISEKINFNIQSYFAVNLRTNFSNLLQTDTGNILIDIVTDGTNRNYKLYTYSNDTIIYNNTKDVYTQSMPLNLGIFQLPSNRFSFQYIPKLPNQLNYKFVVDIIDDLGNDRSDTLLFNLLDTINTQIMRTPPYPIVGYNDTLLININRPENIGAYYFTSQNAPFIFNNIFYSSGATINLGVTNNIYPIVYATSLVGNTQTINFTVTDSLPKTPIIKRMTTTIQPVELYTVSIVPTSPSFIYGTLDTLKLKINQSANINTVYTVTNNSPDLQLSYNNKTYNPGDTMRFYNNVNVNILLFPLRSGNIKVVLNVYDSATEMNQIVQTNLTVLPLDYIWVVGDNGTILKSTNGGILWNAIAPNGISNFDLTSAYFINIDTGYVVGVANDGTTNTIILSTVDGGGTWTTQNNLTNNRLKAVYFNSPQNGFAVGDLGTILSTNNGGQSWAIIPSNTLQNLSAVYFVNAQIGYIVGAAGTLLTTTNGGRTWTTQTISNDSLTGIQFVTPEIGFITNGSGAILKTVNAGNTWSTIAVINDALLGISFPTTTQGYICSALGYILKSVDQGNVWIFQKYIGSLNDILFTDVNNGYIVGKNGLILKTTNAANSWYQLNSNTTNNLSSISAIRIK